MVKNRLLFLMRYAIIRRKMFERGENVMAQETILDKATYKKIKGMSREGLIDIGLIDIVWTA